MARNAGGNKETRPPIERYNRLTLYDQLICFYYWKHNYTGGADGWNPQQAGRKVHHTHFKEIESKYNYNQFYRIGKVSANANRSPSL